MLSSILAALASAIVAVIAAAGYVGIAALMALESACIPLPSEVIMPFAGYLASTGRYSLFGVATAGAIGCNIGSMIAYLVAARGGRGLVERWGSYMLMSRTELDRVEAFFARHGAVTVFVGRLLPVVRTFIAVPAGLARMPQVKFHIYTFAGSWLWCYALAYVGSALGARWDSDPTLRSAFHRFDAVILAMLAAGIGFLIWRKLKTRSDTEHR